MKLKVSAILFLLFVTLNADAQKVAWSRFKFGIQASPTFSWLKTDNPKIGGNGFNTGLKLGATADYYFLENYALSTGIGFAFNHGGKLYHENRGGFLTHSTLSSNIYNELDAKASIRYHIQYVEIPFALKMRTQQFGYMRYFAHAPMLVLGWRTQARGDISTEKNDTKKENIKPDVNPLAISWGFGGGAEYDVSPSTSLVAGLYFQKNFIDVTKNKGNYYIDDSGKKDENSKAVLNSITLRLGVIF